MKVWIVDYADTGHGVEVYTSKKKAINNLFKTANCKGWTYKRKSPNKNIYNFYDGYGDFSIWLYDVKLNYNYY